MISTTESLYPTYEATDYATILAGVHGCGRHFNAPVPCWAIIDDRPTAVDVVLLRGSCDTYHRATTTRKPPTTASCRAATCTLAGRVTANRSWPSEKTTTEPTTIG